MNTFGICFVIVVSICSIVTATDIEYNILEEQLPRTFVGNIADDTGLSTLNISDFNRLQFAILKEGNPYADWFSVDIKTGQLQTTESIDREAVCSNRQRCILGLDIVIYKEDADDAQNLELFQAFPVNIILEDLNDNDPTFPKSELSLAIPESTQAGYVLFISTADDPDSGPSNNVQYYELSDNDYTFNLQQPDANEGNLGLVLNQNLDRERQNFYRFKVIAKDGGNPQRSGSVIVNVTVLDTNDNAPVFQESEYSVSIVENQPIGTVILKLTADDVDIDENGEVFYRFSSRVSDRVDHAFAINETSGEVKVKSIIDFETDKEFQFTVEAFNRGVPPKSAQALCMVTVTDQNDNLPKIHINLPPDTGFRISEEAEVNHYVAQVQTNDADSGESGVVSCFLQTDYFKLESLSFGMYKIKLARQLDREKIPIHNISITCVDNGFPKLSNTTVLVLYVTDANDNFPEFDKDVYNFTIAENNKPDDIIGVIKATDKDSLEYGRVTYHIEQSLDGSQFTIDENSGLLRTVSVFDREKMSHYKLKVIATDSGDIILSSTVVVNVAITDTNDCIPTFSQNQYTFYIKEGEQLGTEVGNVTVTDLDIGNNGLMSFLPDFPFQDVFVIDPTTAKITTKIPLDREMVSIYVFNLTVKDRGNPALSSTARIEIRVIDTNDNVPLVTFPTDSNNSVYVPPLSPVGAVITRIIATDSDTGPNAELTYYIMGGDARNIFKLDNFTGVLTIGKQINEHDTGTYTLLIKIQDNGIPKLSTLTNLVLIIQDDDGQRNMIIAVAVATVTFALSAAMILTICVIRRRDTLKEKEMQMKSHKQTFLAYWLKCLSEPTKDAQIYDMPEKLKETNKEMGLRNGTDMQPIVPDNGSMSSDDCKSDDVKPSNNQNLTKREDSRTDDSTLKDQDSGFGESLERRGILQLRGLQNDQNTMYYLDSRGMRIPSPYLETSLPGRCLKKKDKPTYNRCFSMDEEVLRRRESEKANVKTFSSFNSKPFTDSGNSKFGLFTIAEQRSSTLPQRQSYGTHNLLRNSSCKEGSINSYRNAHKRDINSIAEQEHPHIDLCQSLDRYSWSENNITTRSGSGFYSPRSDTYTSNSDTYLQSLRTENYEHSPRSDIYEPSTGVHLRPDIDRGSKDKIVLNDLHNTDIVV